MRTSPVSAAPPRDPYLDNVKGVLIALVVVGHTLGQVLGFTDIAPYLYHGIYLFHMPAFVLVSGMLAADVLDSRRARGLVTSIVLPYLVFQLIYLLYFGLVDPKWADWSGTVLTTPIYQLWFLPALLGWRLLAPLFAQLRPAVAVLAAVAISIVGAATPALSMTLSLNRMAGMLPFFVLGMVLTRHFPRSVPPALGKVVGAVVLVGILVPGAYLLRERDMISWVNYAVPFERLDVGSVDGAVIRLGFLVVGLVLALALIAVVPRGQAGPLTTMGRYSMYPFLIHGLLTWTFGHSEIRAQVDGPLSLTLLIVIAVVVTYLLASQPVRTVLRPLVEPEARWLFRSTGRRRLRRPVRSR